jgi:hypothetical protein
VAYLLAISQGIAKTRMQKIATENISTIRFGWLAALNPVSHIITAYRAIFF